MNAEDLKPRALSKKEVRDLLKDASWQKDDDLLKKLLSVSNSFEGNTLYSHPTGEILQVFRVILSGILYPSHDAFELRLSELNERARQPRTRHVLEGRLPQGKDFVEHVPQLIEAMAKQLKLMPELLDGSIESLIKIDATIKRYGKKKSLEVPVFPGLVTYVGEAMRREINGKWEMRLNEYDKKTWEPWIVDPEGRYCNPFMAVHDELFDSQGFSIYSSTAVRLNMRRPFPPTPSPALIMTQPKPPES